MKNAKRGFRALQLLGSIPPAPPRAEEQPELTVGQMLHATADVVGVELIRRIPGDEEPLPLGVSVRVIEAPRRDRRLTEVNGNAFAIIGAVAEEPRREVGSEIADK